jgi:hypothetical protein
MENKSVTAALVSLCENSTPIIQMDKADLFPHPQSRLDTIEMKQHPILDDSIPFRDVSNVASKKESISLIINKLDVANNARYQRTVEDTYCNVYSYDFCYFSKVYLPTVWWTDEALEKIKQGQEVDAVFEKTVERIYSSAIHDWLGQWGSHFGWEKMDSLDVLQNKVNANGGVGIICAKRKQKGLSGHIVPVVPETNFHKAHRENGKVLYPLQSQAGKLNYNYFSLVRKDWWNDDLYSSYVLYYHE